MDYFIIESVVAHVLLDHFLYGVQNDQPTDDGQALGRGETAMRIGRHVYTKNASANDIVVARSSTP